MFRIWIYLSIKNFFLAIVSSEKISKKKNLLKSIFTNNRIKAKFIYLVNAE